MPAALVCWERLPSGLRLEVSGKWLCPPNGYARVPLPLPIHKSPAALALFLFLHRIKTAPSGRVGIRYESLLERLGIAARFSSHAQRAFDTAMDVVNKHLNALPVDALLEHRIKAPERYNVELMRDGAVRIVAVPRRQRVDEDEDGEWFTRWAPHMVSEGA